mmetsp:Transcript_57790/g.154392  ORF Transcript_57790/g.154392 Transcript_57790/m.154392 type:complete len:251 (+) Transcript_57790:424-1176(+)
MEERRPEMIASRWFAIPLPCRCFDSASASAALIITFLLASARSSRAARIRLLVSISFIAAFTLASGSRSVTRAFRIWYPNSVIFSFSRAFTASANSLLAAKTSSRVMVGTCPRITSFTNESTCPLGSVRRYTASYTCWPDKTCICTATTTKTKTLSLVLVSHTVRICMSRMEMLRVFTQQPHTSTARHDKPGFRIPLYSPKHSQVATSSGGTATMQLLQRHMGRACRRNEPDMTPGCLRSGGSRGAGWTW